MSRRSPAERLRDLGSTLGLAAVGAFAIALTQGHIASVEARVKETTDAYVLPPPNELVTLSLGYRSALADVLWAHVLVSAGFHLVERRRFEFVSRYIDAIITLDPTYREPYLMADSLLTFQSAKIPIEEVYKAREILERGTRNRPFDSEVWLTLGEFVAYVAPAAYIEDPEEQKRWRTEGAGYLARASELGSEDANVSWRALGGAYILVRAGERDAAIRFLTKTIAVTDDEELKTKLRAELTALLGEREADAYKRRLERFQTIWQNELPFASKTTMLLLGPRLDPYFCAGATHSDDPRCALTWKDWADRQE